MFEQSTVPRRPPGRSPKVLSRVVRLFALPIVVGLCAAAAGAQAFTTLYSWKNGSGEPQSTLIEASDGRLYGTSSGGGVYGKGSVFALAPDGSGGFGFVELYVFTGGNDGCKPFGGVLQASDGFFYGTTYVCGTAGMGTIFRMDAAGNLTTIHEFTGTDGTSPGGFLIEASNGDLYGTTDYGGAAGYGSVFRVSKAGVLATVHSFSSSDGATPTRGLLKTASGNLFGTTSIGGTSDVGTLFQIDSSDGFSTLHVFSGPDGANPSSPPIQDGAGNLYGTTYAGGSGIGGAGTVFRWETGDVLTVVHSFDVTVSARPVRLLLAADGLFYGATNYGGPIGAGTIFRVDAAGTFSTLHAFQGPDGETPEAALMQASDGYLYGTTVLGGGGGDGLIFRVDGTGAVSTVYEFVENPDGAAPAAGLVRAPDGLFYGTTLGGQAGTIFRIDAAGALATLHSFDVADGSGPFSNLLLAPDGSLFGTTSAGGAHSGGVVFRRDPAGAVTTVHDFDPTPGPATEGSSPSGLILGGDGLFYGTTFDEWGGPSLGTIFRMDFAGAVTMLHFFSGLDGRNPAAALVQASDGNFYGTTQYGGDADNGTVFRMTLDGTVTTLHSFTSEGSAPAAPLVEGPDGRLYGTTSTGGPALRGTIFRIDLAGHVTTLHAFDGAEGGSPLAALFLASDGNFYGTSSCNGLGGMCGGNVFRLDSSGTYTSLHTFLGPDGLLPFASLTEGTDGRLYGTTFNGGLYNAGAVFALTPPPALSVWAITPSSGAASGGASITISGFHFQTAAAVAIGGALAGVASVSGTTQIGATAPALPPGTVNDVLVTNPDSTAGRLAGAWFSDFLDIPQGDNFHGSVERIFRDGVTAGCGAGLYCRNAAVTRAQMAVLLLRSKMGPSYVPPPATGLLFGDVPAGSFAASWIEDLAARGITAGCGGGNYCSSASVTRAQMAVFLLRTLLGPGYVPPAPTGAVFDDVPASSFAAGFIEDLAGRRLTGGCSSMGHSFCPSASVTRGQMAAFLVTTFSLP